MELGAKEIWGDISMPELEDGLGNAHDEAVWTEVQSYMGNY